ncbi:methylglyoxal synthase [Rhodospirillum rubrum]|uniref:Methylglyoxal synthase n=1 Tax=Rhodospirillum rubrum (strain ATCC 11170 / ATH 1.1.1 / DSM 467 / LMG 4362 / NCIMB 8255 / S1) TaxID=269796 RepID=Q2RSM7_RHORT|nr:methylglyoxal synthase [Rhodospirillum rubrum]ABC22868.1 Methylglyoxal synthase [Rhodospirillum rubrum ATCC 11170]AEO48591.1 methylglyoxal synthase [Rhodospirillum rubrum F11]MBK5954475.1 methylglyoxal synthase [Rhodospirillum rubrum]QXG78856.1 methylglyoxal synthase [Rhodospirillum rubrum]HAP99392.1 methylglyoxal synthase [Rhodospirillum rubrum]
MSHSPETPPRMTIGLVAHDGQKRAMGQWVAANATVLGHHALVATGTTARVLKEQNPTFDITGLKSGPFGGDQQLGALIAEGHLDCLIFFVDPMEPQPHDVDVKALIRLAQVHEIPAACNRATADLMITSPLFGVLRAGSFPPAEERFAVYANRKV